MMIKVEYRARMYNVEQSGTRYIDPYIFPRAKAYNRLAFDLKFKYNKLLINSQIYANRIWNLLERLYIEACK